MSIGEIYIFLKILIHMSSEKILKIKDYWKIPRGSLNRLLYISRYMSLRRFESLYKIFIISPNLINELIKKVLMRQKPKAWKKLTKKANAGTRRKNVSRLKDSLILQNNHNTPEPLLISF
jgi:hypothetical protein